MLSSYLRSPGNKIFFIQFNFIVGEIKAGCVFVTGSAGFNKLYITLFGGSVVKVAFKDFA